ncbi:MAG: hypothetical protein HN742_09620 [Lentisphaerae bacterium]|jgi:hypothetical protein|nr:hypothetical protein [Lentisphaerota bacterium]MBT5610133.1 hypothetical protein [Lentisphaerota bacterium]MBT7057362.1 hypothetical protein [Lentisphaerota bacterium]MBT7842121.1 hypothetical protein [Lentisphaerota bacterium]
MKTRVALLLGAIVIVVVLLAMTWPISRNSTAGPRLDTLTGAEGLVADLKEIRGASKRQETEVARLGKQMDRLAATDSSDVLKILGPVTAVASVPTAVARKPAQVQSKPQLRKPAPPTRRPAMRWPELRLDGIVAAGNRSMAIINGDAYYLNDKVGTIMISEIDGDAVLLTSPVGSSRRLKLTGWNEETE